MIGQDRGEHGDERWCAQGSWVRVVRPETAGDVVLSPQLAQGSWVRVVRSETAGDVVLWTWFSNADLEGVRRGP